MSDLDAVRKAFAELRDQLRYLEIALGAFVPDASLDRPHGDPTVRFAPNSWRGPDFVGKTFSKCSPEFLEALAETLTYSADNPKPDKLKYVAGNRKDSARARTWARRLRSTAAPAPPPAGRPTNGHAKPSPAPSRQPPAASAQAPAPPDAGLFAEEGDEGLSEDLFPRDDNDDDQDDLFGG